MTYPKLEKIFPTDDFKLELLYTDNQKRVYDFRQNFDHAYYKPLRNIELFKKVSAIDGEILWQSGQDFCPNTLYENSTPYPTP